MYPVLTVSLSPFFFHSLSLSLFPLSILAVLYRKLAIEVNSSDASYMPQNVVVLGGTTSDGCKEINSVSSEGFILGGGDAYIMYCTYYMYMYMYAYYKHASLNMLTIT